MPRVNLIPREERERELRRKAYLFPVAGAALIAISLGGSYYYFDNKLSDTRQEAETYLQNNADIARQVAELQRYESVKKQKQDRLSSVTNTYNQRVRWSRTLDDLAFVVPEDIWLVSIEAKVPGAIVKTTTKAAGKETAEKDLVIEGYTWEMPTVAVFMVRLGLISSLTDVVLISAEKKTVKDKIVTNFKIAASLKPAGDVQKPSVAPTTGEQGPSGVTTTTRTATTTGTAGGTTGTSTSGGGVTP